MITEDYVSFETAKLLKEKGFDADITTYRDDFIKHGNIVIPLQECLSKDKIKTPTLQMVMKWLREAHCITIGITFSLDIITYEIQKDKEVITAISSSRSYEDMVEEAIKFCLENLI
jgi:hypothetical protein